MVLERFHHVFNHRGRRLVSCCAAVPLSSCAVVSSVVTRGRVPVNEQILRWT